MANTLILNRGKSFLTFCDVDFECPSCKYKYTEDDYHKKFNSNSKNHILYMKCKCCKNKIGITFDMMGDVRVWLKNQEKKSW